jgi:hypothetical protein
VQRLDLRAGVVGQRVRLDPRLEVRVGLLGGDEAHALDALDDQLDGPLVAGHLLDDRPGADGEQVLEAGLLVAGVLLGEDGEGLLLGGQGRLDCRQRLRAAHRQRDEQPREQHRVLQRQHRQHAGLPRGAVRHRLLARRPLLKGAHGSLLFSGLKDDGRPDVFFHPSSFILQNPSG